VTITDSWLEKNPFILAPMAGICDLPFRMLCKEMGAGIVISEFISAHGLLRGGPKFKKYLSISEKEKPMAIQLFGHDKDIIAEAAKIVQDVGVDFIDINLGCPVPKVTKKGGGSAWLCYPVELAKMLKTVKDAIEIPLTIKIRTGWDEQSKNALEICKIAENEGISWVAIHGRTRAQGYSGTANWDFIYEIAEQVKIPIIGNGDITNHNEAVNYLNSGPVKGVMIGRAALKNPWIFGDAFKLWNECKNYQIEDLEIKDFKKLPDNTNYFKKGIKGAQPRPLEIFSEHTFISEEKDLEQLINRHLELLYDFYPEVRAQFCFKKFLSWYSAGYPQSNKFRKFIFNTEDFKEVLKLTFSFFEEIKELGKNKKIDRSNEPVLMSGHG